MNAKTIADKTSTVQGSSGLRKLAEGLVALTVAASVVCLFFYWRKELPLSAAWALSVAISSLPFLIYECHRLGRQVNALSQIVSTERGT